MVQQLCRRYVLLMGFCTSGSFAYIVYLAAIDVSNGDLSQTQLIIFFLVIDIVFESLDALFECMEQVRRAILSSNTVYTTHIICTQYKVSYS